jgi:hypothetical protein
VASRAHRSVLNADREGGFTFSPFETTRAVTLIVGSSVGLAMGRGQLQDDGPALHIAASTGNPAGRP